MALSPTRRKQLQRQRDRLAGWAEITVRVAAERAQDVRDFAATLPEPTPPTDPRQLDLLDHIERELSEARSGPGQDDLFGLT